MQTSKITHQINEVAIQQRFTDGYIDATALCKACGKRWIDYFEMSVTQDFLAVLSKGSSDEPLKLIISKPGRYGGTWVHPKIAINLAQWLSPEFAVQVSQWVFDWMSKGGNPMWQENRALIKQSNSKLMDAVKAYIDRHPELSDNAKKWAFINVNDRLCKILTGNRVSKLCRDRQIETWRDAIDTDLAKSLELLETLTIRLIDRTDLLPLDAVKEAASRLLLVDV
jgi:hypothetical protein